MRVCGKNVFKELDITKIKKIYLAKNFKDQDVLKFIKDNNLKYVLTDSILLNKMIPNNQGIIIDIHEYNYGTLDDIKEDNLVLILDHLEDPHNFGAIIRSCEARGVKNIIIPKDRSVNVNETVMKTSAGALSNVNIIMVKNLVHTINQLKDKEYFIYAAEAGGQNFLQVDYAKKICLIIGSEGFGVSPLVKKNSDVIISIPMFGKINSLNASVAAGILLFGIGDASGV
ncbi:MAG: 23S rRNA (guanosine(2251)-2'-O)-methyltransferase RlmB [Bacilli bacterium]|nr:23S rRNA (guanosine(2251)-2'-O)-methyltransferase RlmB [Bacilli bacterium]MDD4795417.1 23S rRNA (guanosine(2251)-2'-O)-methyltransferase RlmB [Bacilli bacterium]